MTTEKNPERADQLDNLLGPPPLLEGEDRTRYLRLRAAVESEYKPQSLFDWISVRDTTDKLWEEQRLKRAASALINGGLHKALVYYLTDTCELISVEDYASDFFNGDLKEKKEVIGILAQHGITMTELLAKAAQIEAAGLQLFDRMVTTRETSRRLLRRERDTRRQDNEPAQNTAR